MIRPCCLRAMMPSLLESERPIGFSTQRLSARLVPAGEGRCRATPRPFQRRPGCKPNCRAWPNPSRAA
jgi:hypothetical protein